LRCKEDFEKKYQGPKRRQAAIDESAKILWVNQSWDGSEREKCPACGAFGFIGGSLWNEEVIETDDGTLSVDDEGAAYGYPPTETIEKTFSIEAFECPVCGLVLDGIKEIAATELPEYFTEREDREREFEGDYGND
jgi:hypothetical protein